MLMRILMLGVLAALTLSAGELDEDRSAACVVVVQRTPNVPTEVLVPTPGPVPEKFYLRRCSDISYKGGGVVIRHTADNAFGWATTYFPAHKLHSVVVIPRQPER